MKSFNTAIYNTPSPAGFELALADVQAKIAQLTFMETVFGIAHAQFRQRNENQIENMYNQKEGTSIVEKYRMYFPQGSKWVGNVREDIDLSFDDSYASRVYFLVKDPIDITPKEYPFRFEDSDMEIVQPFSAIFSFNLDKVETSSYEQIKNSVLFAMQSVSQIKLKNVWEDFENVVKEFTLLQQYRSYDKLPYYNIRVDATLAYMLVPVNGATTFDPSVNIDRSRVFTPNTQPGYANTN